MEVLPVVQVRFGVVYLGRKFSAGAHLDRQRSRSSDRDLPEASDLVVAYFEHAPSPHGRWSLVGLVCGLTR